MNTIIQSKQLLEQLNWRYATKQFDPDRKISPQDWSALEEALVLSPSSGGLQPWAFLVVTDPATREKLLPASYGQTQVTAASHLVVFAAKTNFNESDVDAHIDRTAKLRGIPVESLAPFRGMLIGGIVNAMDQPARQNWAARQAFLALGNLLTSAALLGIDACPMEGFVPAQYAAILGLKEKGLTAVAICTLGYRAETDAYATLPKVRFPKEKVLFHV
jgi:nitroreductase